MVAAVFHWHDDDDDREEDFLMKVLREEEEEEEGFDNEVRGFLRRWNGRGEWRRREASAFAFVLAVTFDWRAVSVIYNLFVYY